MLPRRKINPGFKNLMPISSPVTMGRPITLIGKRVYSAITPPKIPHKSIVTWPPELKVGNVEGKSESTDTHDSEEQAEAVCSLLRKHGFGGLGKHFPISTRVEPVND